MAASSAAAWAQERRNLSTERSRAPALVTLLLTPSPQGRASVFITVPFQISTLEFSPTLEIGSVTLNSNSKQVVVQLPGTGTGPMEGAPMFEIANLELNEGGEIVMMQLNLLGGPKRA